MKRKPIETTTNRQWMLTEARNGHRSVNHYFTARADARDRAKTSRAQGYATKIIPVLVTRTVTMVEGRN